MRHLGYTLTENGIQVGDEKLEKTAKGIARKQRALARVYQLSARQIANLCKIYIVTLLDWGHTVPGEQDLRQTI